MQQNLILEHEHSVLCVIEWIVHLSHCLCSKVEGREKLLISKHDYLLKYLRKKKITFAMPKVKIGDLYESKMCAHAKNQFVLAQILANFFLKTCC
jgi:hypothetical protein